MRKAGAFRFAFRFGIIFLFDFVYHATEPHNNKRGYPTLKNSEHVPVIMFSLVRMCPSIRVTTTARTNFKIGESSKPKCIATSLIGREF